MKKFILGAGRLIFSNLSSYKDITENCYPVTGGGFYEIDFKNRRIILFNDPESPGQVTHKQVMEIIKTGAYSDSFKTFDLFFSETQKGACAAWATCTTLKPLSPREEQMAAIYLRIQSMNVGKVALTGSLMMAIKHLDLRKEANDINILFQMEGDDSATEDQYMTPADLKFPEGFQILDIDAVNSAIARKGHVDNFKAEYEGFTLTFKYSDEAFERQGQFVLGQLKWTISEKLFTAVYDTDIESSMRAQEDLYFFKNHPREDVRKFSNP